ncbi:gliding motility-associated C-terminal domain-containing protein [Fulvivirga maritima]|uniref:gliding motility-associated C-terminal domain-containing protein n=1 Tax=Fulvivirga maritima TaxID=2904247 RepID=UPI001F15E53F|nr:gliding motility-associated C-terminal domain-containing protein [Fulvivirga maritima]UII26253.1 gliding motility-associated C-terminal domain-containing protein [Fulvivirga maritima]
MATGSILNIGESRTIVLTVVANSQGEATSYANSATVEVEGQGGAFFSDISHNGNNPDPNGNGDPTEAGENDPTPVNLDFTPQIGVAKSAGVSIFQEDGSYTLSYLFTVENLGNVNLQNVQVTDHLRNTFPAPVQFSVVEMVTTGSLVSNSNFDGVSDLNLLASGSTLPVGEVETIRLTLSVRLNGAVGPFMNSATGSATGVGGTGNTSDDSAPGTDPDPNGNGFPGDPGEDGGTSTTIDRVPIVGLAMSAATPTLLENGNYEVNYVLVVENLGSVPLYRISVLDVLSSFVFPADMPYTILSLSATNGLVVNEDYDGDLDINMIDPAQSTLAIGATAMIMLSLEVDNGDRIGPFNNIAIVSAYNQDESLTFTDISVNGLDPDPNGNGLPNDPDEDNHTPIFLSLVPVIGVANHVETPELQSDGSYIVDFTVTVENFGNEALSDVRLTSDLRTAFSANAEVEITTAPSVPSNLVVNSAFDGVTETQLIDDGQLEVGEVETVTFSIKVSEGGGIGVYYSQVQATGVGAQSLSFTSDLSQEGLDADPNGDGRPDENDPTTIRVEPNNILGIGTSASDYNWLNPCNIEFQGEVRIKNFGIDTIEDIVLEYDLSSIFPSPITFEVVSIEASQGVNINPEFDGETNTFLTREFDLESGGEVTIEYIIALSPEGSFGEYTTQINASAMYLGETLTTASFDYAGDDFEGVPAERAPTTIMIEAPEQFIPEGFSPNGDGIQDTFDLTLGCGLTAELDVFNRWGDTVYHSGSYNNDWKGETSKGSLIGDTLPNGVYYYTLKISNGQVIKSFVVINR